MSGGGELEATGDGFASELGRLEAVPLREIWDHESLKFTPWLADNLDRLADALGIELELEAREQSVGPFFLDILATTSDGRKVIIENQLEPSDHGHLGQCLTYAAGVDASVVVWVLPRLQPEHRAALDWLNEHTDETVQFFGVELSAVRIGASLPAPMFAVEARPNDWQKRVRKATSPSTGALSGWEPVYALLATVPEGRWIALQDIAKLVRTSPGWIGRHLYGKWNLPGLHRMLYADGSPWRYFQWADSNDQRTQREALEAEGVPFDQWGRAERKAQMTAAELSPMLSRPGATALPELDGLA
jgi:alkylated DNA nucleotide flippase Atl1